MQPEPDTTGHPVWEVYHEHRTARLNSKYYGCMLRSWTRRNKAIELTLAGAAPGSIAAGLTHVYVREVPVGAFLWGGLGVVAGLLAMYKPLSGLSDHIRIVERNLAKYHALDFELEDIGREIRRNDAYDRPLQRRFKSAMEMKKELKLAAPNAAKRDRLQRRCEAEVESELPLDSFHIPTT